MSPYDYSGPTEWSNIENGTIGTAEAYQDKANQENEKYRDKEDADNSNDDIINVNTKTKEATVIKTKDNFDLVSIDGQKPTVVTTQGSTEKELKNKGYSIMHPYAVGMGVMYQKCCFTKLPVENIKNTGL
jgi:hypothetical protein